MFVDDGFSFLVHATVLTVKKIGGIFFFITCWELIFAPGGRISLVKNWRQETDLTGIPLTAHHFNCLPIFSACPKLGPQIFMLAVTVTSGGPRVIGQQSSA